MKRAIAYIRRSTRKETQKASLKRQIKEVNYQAQKHGYYIIKIFDDTVSGSKPFLDRRNGKAIMGYLSNPENKVECFIVDEISRLGRKGFDIVETAKAITHLEVQIIYCGRKLLNDQGEVDSDAFTDLSREAAYAQYESERLIRRIKSGLANSDKKGGRPVGIHLSEQDFLKKHKDVVKLLKLGNTVRDTVKVSGKSLGTVAKVRKYLVVKGAVNPRSIKEPESPKRNSRYVKCISCGSLHRNLKRIREAPCISCNHNVPWIKLGPNHKPIYYNAQGKQTSNQLTKENHQKFLELIERLQANI